jgi:hypothetical protein
MPANAQRGVGRRHAFAVVDHPHARHAPGLDLDDDAPRAGVDRVLQQLFDHAGRPLDDLSRRDLIG